VPLKRLVLAVLCVSSYEFKQEDTVSEYEIGTLFYDANTHEFQVVMQYSVSFRLCVEELKGSLRDGPKEGSPERSMTNTVFCLKRRGHRSG
jgi:hypothetical protein